MNFGLKGKTCLVVGASKGLGLASALSLSKEGAHVVLMSRSLENLLRAKDEILAVVPDAVLSVYAGDLSDIESISGVLEQIQKDNGGIDVFVGSSGGPKPGPALTMSYTDILDALNSNFLSLMNLTQIVALNMKKKNCQKEWQHHITN